VCSSDLERFHIDHLFDAVVSSYDIQKKKPSPDAYQYVSNQIVLKPEECLFIDDSEKNVIAAKEIGMQGLIFRTFEDFKEQLENILGEKF
jgi:putative hydrolase of the HAD superfamily